MPNRSCCVPDCRNTANNSSCSFYSFPTSKHKLIQRRKWIAAMNKYCNIGAVWTPKKHHTICSEHFIGGKKSEAETSPSYTPTLFPSSLLKANDDWNCDRELKEKMKFMEDFNPDRSDRERRKLTKKIASHTRAAAAASVRPEVYNEAGLHVPSGKDMCDCFSSGCPGCHLPCPKCRSTKCGVECRVSRKWSYDLYHIEGLDLRRVNRLREFEKARTDGDQ